MRSILLIGGSGTLGPLLVSALSTLGRVTVTQRRDATQSTTYFDASAIQMTERLDKLQFSSFDTVVYAAAQSTLATCEKYPDRSHLLNYEIPIRLALAAKSARINFVFLSSSAAAEYDGMSETTALEANKKRLRGASTYGLHKFLAERELCRNERALVVRIGKVASLSWPLIPLWVSELSKDNSISAFSDDYVSPIQYQTLDEVLISALRLELTGLLEISASDRASYFEVASYLAVRLGKSLGLISAVSATTSKEECMILSKSALDNVRARALLGFTPPTTFEVIEKSYLLPLASPSK